MNINPNNIQKQADTNKSYVTKGQQAKGAVLLSTKALLKSGAVHLMGNCNAAKGCFLWTNTAYYGIRLKIRYNKL